MKDNLKLSSRTTLAGLFAITLFLTCCTQTGTSVSKPALKGHCDIKEDNKKFLYCKSGDPECKSPNTCHLQRRPKNSPDDAPWKDVEEHTEKRHSGFDYDCRCF
jgi:hypothetical protein